MSRVACVLCPALFLGLAGCLDEFADGPSIRNKAIDVPTLPEAATATAARVDQVGRQLVGQNPFLGVEPTFHTYGRAEPEVTHPDLNGVLVTEGLVARCKTDAELAAVLAVELAKMSAERRASDRLRAHEPLPHLPDAGAAGPATDPTQVGTQAVIDRGTKPKRPRPDDPLKSAEEILKAAGFDPKALDAVAPLLREAERNRTLTGALDGRGAAPRWTN